VRAGGTGIDRDTWTVVEDELGYRYLVGEAGQPGEAWARPAQLAAAEPKQGFSDGENPPARFERIERAADGAINTVSTPLASNCR